MIYIDYSEDGRLVYPFISWLNDPLKESLRLWDYNKENVFWENALYFELWKGAITHTEAMKLTPNERRLYTNIAQKLIKERSRSQSSITSGMEEAYGN